MDANKQIEQLKLSAVKWEHRARQVAAEGNLVGAFRCHEWMKADLAYIKTLETPTILTRNYTRFIPQQTPEQMIVVGPHEAVNKAYYDRYLHAKRIAPTARANADDNKELPPSEAG